MEVNPCFTHLPFSSNYISKKDEGQNEDLQKPRKYSCDVSFNFITKHQYTGCSLNMEKMR